MKTKERDVKYCNVREDYIKSNRPDLNDDRVRMLYDYIIQRYRIHLNRDYYKTEDYYESVPSPIFREYKFTNIRREHDRTTKYLIENISHNENISYVDKIYKSILFRLYNRLETADFIRLSDEDFFTDAIYSDKTISWVDKCRERFSHMRPEYRVYTNAYKTGGTNAGLKKLFPKEESMYMCPVLLVNQLIQEDFASQLTNCNSQLEVLNLLYNIKGIGYFIAYQLYVDLTYIEEFPFSENEFTVAGPGCHYGIELLLKDRYDFKGFTPEELVFWIRDNIGDEFNRLGLDWDPKKVFIDLPDYDQCLNVMSVENIMCEFQKWVRANSPEMSNPRNKYHKFVYSNPAKE